MSKERLPNITAELRKKILSEDPNAFSKGTPSLRHIRMIIHEVIFGTDTSWGKGFDVVLLYAIVISLVTIMLESVGPIHDAFDFELFLIEWIFTVLFTLEYVLRLWASDEPRKYAFSFFGIVDLLAVIPTYLSLFVAGSQFLLVIRVLRLLRVFRVLKLARYLKGANLLVTSLRSGKEKIFVFLTAVVTLVTILGTLMYMIEGGDNGFDSIPRSIYWAVVTLTTVGYGDIAPATTLGQFVAAAIMILGYAIIAVPTGIVGVEMAKASAEFEEDLHLVCNRCGETDHHTAARFCHKCGERLVST